MYLEGTQSLCIRGVNYFSPLEISYYKLCILSIEIFLKNFNVSLFSTVRFREYLKRLNLPIVTSVSLHSF